MKNILPICLGVSALVLTGAVAYYLLIIQPREAQAQLDSQKKNEAYQACLKNPPTSNTGNPYLDKYDQSCAALKP